MPKFRDNEAINDDTSDDDETEFEDPEDDCQEMIDNSEQPYDSDEEMEAVSKIRIQNDSEIIRDIQLQTMKYNKQKNKSLAASRQPLIDQDDDDTSSSSNITGYQDTEDQYYSDDNPCKKLHLEQIMAEGAFDAYEILCKSHKEGNFYGRIPFPKNIADIMTCLDEVIRVTGMMIKKIPNLVFRSADLYALVDYLQQYWFLKISKCNRLIPANERKNVMYTRFSGSDITSPEYPKDVAESAKAHLANIDNVQIFLTHFDLLSGEECDTEKVSNTIKVFASLATHVKTIKDLLIKDWLIENRANEEMDASTDQDVKIDTENNLLALVNDKDLTSAQKLMIILEQKCKDLRLRKTEIQLWEEVRWEGVPRGAYKPYMTAKEYLYSISRVTKSVVWTLRTDRAGNVAHVLTDFEDNVFQEGCPVLKRDMGYYCFKNGNYYYQDDIFIPFDQDCRIKGLTCMRAIQHDLTDFAEVGPHFTPGDSEGGGYFDITGQKLKSKPQIRSWKDIPTPLVDKIMSDQNWGEDVQSWFFVLAGRMVFGVGKDKGGDGWQICPFFFGKAGTGKSTLAMLILSFFDECDAFKMESSGESTFQLQNAPGKLIWCILELKKELRLASDRYQMMVSGEDMVIPRKNRDPVFMKWLAHGLLVGNDIIPFKDAMGSISRRTVTFEFVNAVKTNTCLGKQLQNELPNFLRKCIMAYIHTRNVVGDRSIWEVLPKYFHTTQKSMSQKSDPLCMAMKNALLFKEDLISPFVSILDEMKRSAAFSGITSANLLASLESLQNEVVIFKSGVSDLNVLHINYPDFSGKGVFKTNINKIIIGTDEYTEGVFIIGLGIKGLDLTGSIVYNNNN